MGQRTTLAGMLADHGMRPVDAAPVTSAPALIDIEAQIATLEQLDPGNPSLPQLRAAVGRGDLTQAKGLLGGLDNGTNWGKWLAAIVAIAGIAALLWFWYDRKKKKRPIMRRNDDPADDDFGEDYDGNDY
jgi:hypothetical protein